MLGGMQRGVERGDQVSLRSRPLRQRLRKSAKRDEPGCGLRADDGDSVDLDHQSGDGERCDP